MLPGTIDLRGEKDEKSLISLRRPHKAPIWEKILVATMVGVNNGEYSENM